MSNYKDRKLLVDVQEFNKDSSTNRYQINGINLDKAIFFWRIPQGMYDVIPTGSYRIVNEGANVFLEIIDTTVYANVERIQICYQFASMSSEYDVDFNVDITTLKDRYNELVKDVKAIFGYVEKNMMTSDGLDVSIILPQLDKDEVWMKTETGYKGFNVGDIEANIQSFWDNFDKVTSDAYKKIIDEGQNQVDRIIAEGNTQDKRVEDEGQAQVDRVNAVTHNVSKQLDLIWRMYSIITGSNRYLSGNYLPERINLDRTVDGGSISTRPANINRSYSGGSIANRAITVPLTVDLDEYK